ncbi:MAG: Fur family transcriptional regulator [Planctomycetota bacterium]
MHATDIAARLIGQGIRPSAQRVAIAGYVLTTDEHPSADSVWRRVREQFPMVSRATVYNTLNLFAERGLVRELTLAPGCSVFDANTAPHHHFVDDADGSIHDVPWESVAVSHIDRLRDYDVREFSVVMRGRRRGPDPG